MKLSVIEAEKRFGHDVIEELTNIMAEPTSRMIYPSFEPTHDHMVEYIAGSVYVEGGKLAAYYFQPEGAEDWEFGEMNGIEYGDIEYIEFTPDL